MDKTECLTISSKTFKFKNIDEDTAILEEYDKQRQSITNQYLIEYYKMFDKTILSGMSIEKLKKLVELINEVIADKISECEVE
jgi:hypothetical protein